MNKKELVVLIAAGFLGGAVSSVVINSHTAWATAVANDPSKVITASGLRLLDKNGAPRVIIGESPNGGYGLWFVEPDGSQRITILMKDDGWTAIGLRNHGNKAQTMMSLSRDGISNVVFDDAQGRRRAALGLVADGDPSLSLSGPEGMATAGVYVSNSQPLMLLTDAQKKSRVWMGLEKDGSPSVNLKDDNGKLRAVLGYVELNVPDKGIKESRPESSLVLFSKDGNLAWSAPR